MSAVHLQIAPEGKPAEDVGIFLMDKLFTNVAHCLSAVIHEPTIIALLHVEVLLHIPPNIAELQDDAVLRQPPPIVEN